MADEVLRCIIVAFVLAVIYGCEFQSGGDNEKEQVNFFIAVTILLEESSGTPVADADVQFLAHKIDDKSGTKISGKDLSGTKKTKPTGKCDWTFGYKLLYDSDSGKYLESALVDIYVNKAGFSQAHEEVYFNPDSGRFSWNEEELEIYLKPL